ncbi:putative ribonuclease H-like domain-containing protein [Tanacetum coccineum]
MDAYRDNGMGDVIVGELFLREDGIKAKRFEGIITFYKGDDEVTYQMVRSHPRFKNYINEQCNKIPPLLNDPTTFKMRRRKNSSHAGTLACMRWNEEKLKKCQARKETKPVKDYNLLPLWTADLTYYQDPKSSHDDGFKPSSDDVKKVDEDPRRESECNDQEKEDNVNSTNNVNVVGTNEVNNVGGKTSVELPFDPNMSALEDYSIFDFSRDDEDDVDLPNGKRAIGSKWVLENKKDEKGIMIRNKARLVAQGYTQEEGIDYDEIEEEVYVCQPLGFEDPDFLDRVYKVEKALYGLHQAPRAWYEILSAYLLDNEIQKGKIDKTLFIKRYKGDILLMSSIGELTFFLGLQVKQKKDGIFISQDKYVEEILKKFRFTEVKTVSIPMETQKPLLKDENGEEVDVHMFRSMIGSLMYLTSSRSDIMFAVYAYARYQVNPNISHLHDVKRIFRYLKGQPKLGLWYPKDSPFDLVAYTDGDYAGASLDRKSTTGDEAVHKELGDSLVRAATTSSSLEAKQDSGNITKTRSKATPNESSSLGTTSCGGPRCQETMGDTTARTRFESVSKHSNDSLLAKVLDLEKTKTTQANEIASLKRRVKKLEKKDRSRTYKLKRLYKIGLTARVESSGDEEISVQDDSDKELFDIDALNGEDVFVAGQNENVVEEVVNDAQVSTALTTVTITTEEITLAQALEALKTSKPKVKGIVIQEPAYEEERSISFDEETALRLQAEFDEEERLARQNAEKEKEINIALIEEWDDIQAKIDADHQLAERLQAQE